MVLYSGKIVKVFDSELWRKNGGDSKTDDFYREAEIVKTHDGVVDYWPPAPPTVTVKFLHSGRVSAGHFVSGIKEVYRNEKK
jgi:hypothetical protein